MDRALFVGPLDRVLLLRTVPMLEELGPIQLAAIAQHARERFLTRGTSLRLGRDAAETIHLVVDGELEMTRSDGTSRTLARGDAVGFLEMLSRSELALEVRAISDTTTLELDWDAQIDVCEEHFAVVMQYVAHLSGRILDALGERPAASQGPVQLLESQRFSAALNLIERTLVLSGSGALSSGCLDALSELAHHVKEVRSGGGHELWAIDDPADHFLLIAAGCIRCGPAAGAFEHRAGTVVGLYESLCRRPRWHGARSESGTIALRIEIEPFIDILEDHFDLALDLLAALARELMELEEPTAP